jgi:NTP pyrophosphatase (non-canonical NTP hydrolase)
MRIQISQRTFDQLRLINRERCYQWHGPDSEPWTGADWSNAMCGEAGETANAVKKMRRLETRVRSKNATQPEEKEAARQAIRKEIGDTLIYLDLLADHYGINLATARADVFNSVSEREGFDYIIEVVQ